MTSLSIEEVNELSSDLFIERFSNVVENWKSASQFVANWRPYKNIDEICQAFYRCLDTSSMSTKKAILQSHPEIGSKGKLTKESVKEQMSTGVKNLTEDEREKLSNLNKTYYDKFGFPFVICARQNSVQDIIRFLEKRLNNTEFEEIEIAIEEVKKIIALRIKELIA